MAKRLPLSCIIALTLIFSLLYNITVFSAPLQLQSEKWVKIASYSIDTGIIQDVALSPSGKRFAYSDSAGAVNVFNISLQRFLTLKFNKYADISVGFVDENILYIVVQRPGISLPFLMLIDIDRNVTLFNQTFQQDIGNLIKTIERDNNLFLMFSKILIVLDREDYKMLKTSVIPKGFGNKGLQMFFTNDSKLFILAIMTHCHICLERNEKYIFLIDPSLDKEYSEKLDHILAVFPIENNSKFAFLMDDGDIRVHSYSSKEKKFVYEYSLRKIDVGGSMYLTQDYKVLYFYEYDKDKISVRAHFLENSTSYRKYIYEKLYPGEKILFRANENGLYSILIKSVDNTRLIVGNIVTGVYSEIKVNFSAKDMKLSENAILVYGLRNIEIFTKQKREKNSKLLIEVVDKNDIPIDKFRIVFQNGSSILCTSNPCEVLLKNGLYTFKIEAEGYSPVTLTINLTTNDYRKITLYPITYTLGARSIDEKGNMIKAEITILREEDNTTIIRGKGYVEAEVPPGKYKVIAVYENRSMIKYIDITQDTTIDLIFKREKYKLSVKFNKPLNVEKNIIIIDKNTGNVVYNETFVEDKVEIDLYPGSYLVKIISLNHEPFTTTINLSSNMELDVSLYPLQKIEFIAVIYGVTGCPHCHETNETLRKIIDKVYFREISDMKYAQQYETLYKYLKAGEREYVPLTIIFYSNKPVIAVVGSLPIEYWKKLMSSFSEDQVLVIDENGNLKYVSVNQTKIYQIVFGESRSIYEENTTSIENILPLVITLAAADSVNPCTFLVFTALLIMTIRISGKRKMLLASASFIAAIFTAYLLLGLGLLKVFAYIPWIKYLLAALAIGFGLHSLYSIKGGEFHSPVPENWKKFIEDSLSKISRSGSPILAFTLGILISLTLLPCSSGPYIVAMYVLSKLPFLSSFLYLVLYNVIFVLPLILITIGVAIASSKIRSIKKTRTKLPTIFEALSGILLILIGIYVLLYM